MVARLKAIAAVIALAAGGLLVTSGSNVGALDQGSMTVGPGQSVSKQFPIIAANNPANQAHDPATCRLSPYCDTIRLNIIHPEDPDVGWFVRVQMGWTTRAEADVPTQGEMTDNDMDMFIYQVPYDDNKPDSENELTHGATGAQPETAYVDKATAVDIVVVNFLGLNTDGYKLTVTFVTEDTFTPFESVEDESFPTPSESLAPLIEEAAAEEPPPAEAPPTLASAPSLSRVGVDDPFGLSTGAATAPPQVSLLREVENTASAPPEPVSTGLAMLWLAVVPGALLGSVALFLIRRRRSAFGV